MQKSGRYSRDERGETNPFLITTIIFVLLAVGLGVGFGWAYMQMTDYKDNVSSKVAVAVKEAKASQKEADDKQFAEDFKKPNLVFEGPSDSGSVSFNYPKTWASYAAKDGSGDEGLEVYFSPKQVAPIKSDTPYALRVNIVNNSYNDVLKTYQSKIKDGKLSAAPITLGKTDSFGGYKGTRIDGQFEKTINGSVVIFKIRDKTLQIFVDNKDFMNDFDNTILPSLKYES